MGLEESLSTPNLDVPSQTQFLLHATGDTIEILPGTVFDVETIYQEIFENNMYGKHGVGVRPGDVVLDIGANIGMFCIHAARASSGPGGQPGRPVKYYGFEALQPVFEVLKRNASVAASGGGMVKSLFNVGIGDEKKDGVRFTYFPLLPGNSTLNPVERMKMQDGIKDPKYFVGAREYVVSMKTVSDVIEELGIEKVDFLKVDVEGAELMVLKGVKEADWGRIWQVVVEVPDADEEESNDDGVVPVKRVTLVMKLLKERGFVVNVEFDTFEEDYMVYAKRA